MSALAKALTDDLIAHWTFQKDVENSGPVGLIGRNHNVIITPDDDIPGQFAAAFNGKDSYLEIADHPALNFSKDDFSISLWVKTEAETDVVGDLISKFDTRKRRGWTLSTVTNSGTTTTAQSNYRNVHFGIDDQKQDKGWTLCGRPGNAVFVYALATIKGELYAGTFESEAGQKGHLWRYQGGAKWEDLGSSPDGSNLISSIVEFHDEIYCGSSRYYPRGSCLGLALNRNPGGHVYRITVDGAWHDCGNPAACVADAEPKGNAETTIYDKAYESGLADDASALTVWRGNLYAISLHCRGVFRYLGGTEWEHIGLDSRVMTLCVFHDELFALSNGGPVYRYEGEKNWQNCGTPARSTQNYGTATFEGKLLTGTWPECEVHRYEGGQDWLNLGRVGYEREVMAMSLYNSKVYCGTLPMANVFRIDEKEFSFTGNLDNASDYRLRRVWSMAVFQGKLYAGTLPSGNVLSYEAGKMATHDHRLTPGWHHIVATREGNFLNLYIDGNLVARSTEFSREDFNLTNAEPLKIGFGAHDYFCGKMRDVRIYRRAISPQELMA